MDTTDARDNLSEEFLNSDIVDDDFFISIVENKLKINRDAFKLRLVLISPAVGKNENFMSIVFRAKIKFTILSDNQKQQIDVIVKVMSDPGMKEYKIYPREKFIYEVLLDKFESLWLTASGESIRFGPKSIKFLTEPYEVMVLDDLKVEKYKLCDRKVGLNVEQSRLFLSKLAKFHAVSAQCYQKEGKIDNLLDRKISNPPIDPNSPFVQVFGKVLTSFVKMLKQHDEFEKYAAKIARWSISNMFTLFTDIAEPMRNGFSCLNHGDDFVNNLMFNFDDEGNAKEIIFIDFQAALWASPGPDLLYFFISSLADDIKAENFDNFIEFYHEELVAALKTLKYEQHIPTLAELHIDVMDKGSYGALCLVFIMFLVRFDSEEPMNMNFLMGSDADAISRYYGNENYLKALRSWLPFLNKRGFLDCLIRD